MTDEQAVFLAEQMVNLMQGEFPATKKVLAAVKDDTRDYRPDAKSRTAWELVTHMATADVWFLDSVLAGEFKWDPEAAKAAEANFKTVADVVAFYKETMPAKFQKLKALKAAELTKEMDFFGVMKMPAVSYIGFANNHSIHHRGQLAAYLRALGSKVPDIYGPSADSAA